MLKKRIIPCLDVKNGRVVKGVEFKGHEDVGDILELALSYAAAGADELVFYDITASVEGRSIASDKGGWVNKIGRHLNIPFTVAGGIRSLGEARMVLEAGADKVSINSPALENPSLITSIATEYGVQCVVVGIDSMVVPKRSLQAKQRTAESSAKHSKMLADDCDFEVWQYTGSESHSTRTPRSTGSWIREAIDLGAGEIVLNCMNQDGRRSGYDLHQLAAMRKLCNVPLVASGGAGSMADFADVFDRAAVDGALAASVFHKNIFSIGQLKSYLAARRVPIRPLQ